MLAQPTRPRLGSRWLLPREHGAYAEVLFPVVTVLCLGRASLPSVALSVAVIAGFLAHEPLLILLGARGGAVRRQAASRARVQAVLLGTLSVGAAALGLTHAAPVVLWAAAALVPALVLALGVTLARREKSLFGEVLIALLFAAVAVPVGVAADLPLHGAARAAAAWAAVFLVGTASVHALLARKRSGARAPSRVVIAVCVALALGAGLSALFEHGWWLVSIVPMLVVSAGSLLIGLPPKRLKRLGWAMVMAHVGTMIGLWLWLPSPASHSPSAATAPVSRVLASAPPGGD